MTTTRVTRLTPPGRGAIATVAVRGPAGARAIAPFFTSLSRQPIEALDVGRVLVGHWQSNSTSEELVIGCVADEHFEVHCHGGELAVQRIVTDLTSQAGVRAADAGDLFAPQLDAVQRTAWQQLQQARTARCAAMLLDQYHGAMSRELALLGNLTDKAARQRRIDLLLAYRPLAQHLVEPWRVSLAGPPNVGKSSLFNALLGYSRAIVFPQPGTTRDAITAITIWDGWPIELIDTAGLRDTDSQVERQGIEIAQQQRLAADLVLRVYDAREPAAEPAERELLVANKCDLGGRGTGIPVSAKRGDGIAKLSQAIVKHLIPQVPAAGSPLPISASVIAELKRLRDD